MNECIDLKQMRPKKITLLKQLVLLVCLFLSINVNAFTVDDIEYAISSETECSVTRAPHNYTGKLVIPSSVINSSTGKTYKVTSIGDNAFGGCSGLTSLKLPEGLTWIVDDAFSGCSSLTSLTLPSGLISIGYAAFCGCIGLTSLTLPETLISVYYSAFENCSSLSSIYAYNPIPPTAELTAFDEVPTSCALHVPIGSKPKYLSDPVWGVFDVREFNASGINDAIIGTDDMDITQSANGALMIKSKRAMVIPIYTEGGAMVRRAQLQSGENTISGLQKGLYIVNGTKVIIR